MRRRETGVQTRKNRPSLRKPMHDIVKPSWPFLDITFECLCYVERPIFETRHAIVTFLASLESYAPVLYANVLVGSDNGRRSGFLCKTLSKTREKLCWDVSFQDSGGISVVEWEPFPLRSFLLACLHKHKIVPKICHETNEAPAEKHRHTSVTTNGCSLDSLW